MTGRPVSVSAIPRTAARWPSGRVAVAMEAAADRAEGRTDAYPWKFHRIHARSRQVGDDEP